MVRDFVTLTRVQWKRGKAGGIQWLRLIGYDPNGSRLYKLYFWLFWLFWLVAMWSFSVEQVYQLSVNLPVRLASNLFAAIPLFIFALQLLYLAASLYDEPLKLSEETLAYVAFSPVNRASIVILEWMRALVLPALFVGVISCFLGMLLTWHSAPGRVGLAGLSALLASVAVVYFSAALAWALALWKFEVQKGWRRQMFWLVLPVAVLAAIITPTVLFFPGHIGQHAANLTLSPADIISFMALFAAALACLLAVGRRVHMTAIADASQTYAHIQRLGPFGRWYATDVINRLRRQTRLASTARSSVKLSKKAVGYRMLWNRAGVVLRRLFPGSVLQPLMLGSSLTVMITSIVRIGGWRSLQSWALVLLILCIIRLKSVIRLFRQDVTQSFLRQMLPSNNLALFIVDSSYAVLLAMLGSAVVILLQPWDLPLLVGLVGLLGVTALSMSLALELVEDHLIIHRRIPFEYMVILGGGGVIAAGLLAHSGWAAAGALLVINALLGMMLYYSRP